MSVISSGTWPIDPTTTSGTELAAYLNEVVNAIQTTQASPSRPAGIQKGGLWTKTLGAADVAVMVYDGTADFEIGRISGGSASFGGTAASTTAPTPAVAGSLWVDTSTAGSPVLKVYNGTAWVATGDGVASSATAPTTPAPVSGDLWVDKTTATAPVLKVYNGTAWVAVGGVHKGTAAPTTPAPASGDLWVDTTTAAFPVVKMYNGTAWVDVHDPATQVNATATGSLTLDLKTYQNFVLTMTGNVTLANPTTETIGHTGFIVFKQDGTGGRTVSLGTQFKTASAGGLTLSAGADAVDIVPYAVMATDLILLGAPQLDFQ